VSARSAGATEVEVAARPVAVKRPARVTIGPWRPFVAILWRDIFVSGKESWVMLVQVAVTPLFMLFIFAKVLGTMNYVSRDYGHLLLPGILALSTFLAALQSVAAPLVMEFGWTKEIEDRLLAPLPTSLVAVEKVVVATLRGLVSAIIMYPIGALVLGTAPWRLAGLPVLLLILTLGACAGGCVGLTIGTLVPPSRINIMFALILTPIMFTGSIQYPWPELARLRWFQVITGLNPLTYCAEGVRAALVPDVPHVPAALCALALIGGCLLFGLIGIAGFRRRALS
jgi:ABC-2 type transport system permease protein